VPCPAIQYFCALSRKRHDFQNKKENILEHKMSVLFLSATLSEAFLILKRNEQDMITKMYIGLHVKSDLNGN
jgi:hypothetical protein